MASKGFDAQDDDSFNDVRGNSYIDSEGHQTTNFQAAFESSSYFEPFSLPSFHESFQKSTILSELISNKNNTNGSQNIDGSERILKDLTNYAYHLHEFDLNDNSRERLIKNTNTTEASEIEIFGEEERVGTYIDDISIDTLSLSTAGTSSTFDPYIIENSPFQLDPIFPPCEYRPPKLMPSIYPKTFCTPSQLVSSVPLCATSNKTHESIPEPVSDKMNNLTDLDTNVSQNLGLSQVLSPAKSHLSICELEKRICKKLKHTDSDYDQLKQKDLNKGKTNRCLFDIIKLTEDVSLENTNYDDWSLPSVDTSYLESNFIEESLDIIHAPNNIVSNEEKGNIHSSNVSVIDLPEPTSNKNSIIVTFPSDQPVSMTLPENNNVPFSTGNNNIPNFPISMHNSSTTSMDILEDSEKLIAINVADLLEFAPDCEFDLNAPSPLSRNVIHLLQEKSTVSSSSNKIDSYSLADDRSVSGTRVPTTKCKSPPSATVKTQTFIKYDRNNGVEALDQNLKNCYGIKRGTGKDMEVCVPLDEIPFLQPQPQLSTTCPSCYKTFSSNFDLDIHYQNHTKDTTFVCAASSSSGVITSNMKQKTLTNVHCEYPGQVSSDGNAWINTCSTPKTIVCKYSFKETVKETSKHLQIKDPSPVSKSKRYPPKHICQECSKRFSSPSHLRIHMKTHTGEKPFHCDICSKDFIRKEDLKKHVGYHMMEKKPLRLPNPKKKRKSNKPRLNHTCHLCDKRFNFPSHLLAHMRTHTGEKPFHCLICNQAFTMKVSMINHMKKKLCK